MTGWFTPLARSAWLLDVGVLDIAAPGTGFMAALLDEGLEPLKITIDAAGDESECVTDCLDHTLRVVLKLERHPRLVRGERVEGDDSGVAGAGRVFPGDPLVRMLLRDYGVPLFSLAGDRGLPMQPPIIELANLLDPFHEA